MAEFRYFGATPDPNYTNTTHPISDVSPDKSYGTLFSQIGSTLDAGITAVDKLAEKKYKDKASDLADQAIADFPKPEGTLELFGMKMAAKAKLVGQGTDGSVTGESAGDINTPGFADEQADTPAAAAIFEQNQRPRDIAGVRQQPAETAPPALSSNLEDFARMARAEQARANPMYWGAYWQSQLQQLKSQNPGYKDVIDKEFQRVTGINPANLLIHQTWSAYQSILTAQNSQLNKDVTWANSKEVVESVQTSIMADPSMSGILQPLQMRASRGDAESIRALRDWYGSKNNSLMQVRATTELAALQSKRGELAQPQINELVSVNQRAILPHWDAEIRAGATKAGLPYKTLQDMVEDTIALANSNSNPAQLQANTQYLNNFVSQKRMLLENHWNKMVSARMNLADGSETSMMKLFAGNPKAMEEAKNQFMRESNTFFDAIADPKSGVGALLLQANKLQEENDKSAARTAIGNRLAIASQAIKMLDADTAKRIQTLPGAQKTINDLAQPVMKNLYLEAGADSKANPTNAPGIMDIQRKAEVMGVKPDGTKVLPGEAAAPRGQTQRFSPQMIKDLHTVASGTTSVEDRAAFARIIANNKNNEWLDQFGERDVMKIFRYMNDPGVIEKLQGKDRDAWGAWSEKTFGFLMDKKFNGVKSMLESRPGLGLRYDEQTNQLIPQQNGQDWRPRKPGEAITGVRSGDTQLMVQFNERVSQINEGLGGLAAGLGDKAKARIPALLSEMGLQGAQMREDTANPEGKLDSIPKTPGFAAEDKSAKVMDSGDLKTAMADVVSYAKGANKKGASKEAPVGERHAANAAFAGPEWGNPGTHGFENHLTQLTTASGKTVIVNKKSAAAFAGFLRDLEATGYKIETLGGFDIRANKSNPSRLSQHSFGNALDINAKKNAYGQSSHDFPPEIVKMARKWKLSWGGEWNSVKDPMHFEYSGP